MPPILRHPFRFLWKLGALAGFIWRLILHYRWLRKGGVLSAEDQQQWMQSNAQRLARLLRLRIRCAGRTPQSGLIASNHLGYLDIVTLATATPGIFVSKSEVRRWPLIGMLSVWGGTLYLRRARRTDVARISREIADALKAKQRVIIFPEGTSTNGRQVLNFHSSLFSPAAAAQSPVTPCFIRYREPGNDPENRVCYWGTAWFLPHFLNLLALERIEAELLFGKPIAAATRKQLANAAHASVIQLAAAPPSRQTRAEE